MKKKAKSKAKAGKRSRSVKDLAATKSVKGGLLPAVRTTSTASKVSSGLLLPAVQKVMGDGSV